MVKSSRGNEDHCRGARSGSILRRSLSSDQDDYEGAIKKLNRLQSNAATIHQSEAQGPTSHVVQAKKVENTSKYLSRIGISLEKLDGLSVVHIAGTKGKGTTAALCESIIRHHGYRTGFFSSPHLVAVRERIRINGLPLSLRKFTDYLNFIHNKLELNKDNDADMPAYFKFLTVMAFHVFLKEEVDVAIVEVGIGGEYDCTNCIRKPAVVGITTLGLDHTNILGTTLPDIAWQKAGIMKSGSRAFTVPQPSPAAMDVLSERARNRQCSLMVSPPLDSYTWENGTVSFNNMVEDVYATNASLALQLANAWLQLQSPFYDRSSHETNDTAEVHTAEPFPVTSTMVKGLVDCSWPGRTQIIRRGRTTYFLDGAHTSESISYCLRWFNAASSALQPDPEKPKKVLVFNVTGPRNAEKFISELSHCNFHRALFPKIVAFPKQNEKSDQYMKHSPNEEECQHSSIWQRFSDCPAKNFSTMSEALDDIAEDENEECHVLITGSVHLVGCALRILDPMLSQPVTRIPAGLRPLQSIYSTVQAIL